MQQEILQYQRDVARIEADTADLTKEEQRAQISKLNDKLTAEARKAVAEADVAEGTKENQIKQAELAVQAQEQGLVKGKADIAQVNSTIQKIATEIKTNLEQNQREWTKLNQREREMVVEQTLAKNEIARTEFNTSTAAQIGQWTGIIGNILSGIKPLMK